MENNEGIFDDDVKMFQVSTEFHVTYLSVHTIEITKILTEVGQNYL